MGLLEDAANAWVELSNKRYQMLLGRKGKWSAELTLTFCNEEFPHLAGFHYANDIDFGVNKVELHGPKLLPKIADGSITTEQISKSVQWSKIAGRLEGIIKLEETLDSDFLIYAFHQDKVPYGSTIEANYVIKNVHSGMTFFVFIVEDDENIGFCRSIFYMNKADYSLNQPRLTILKKTKYTDGDITFSFVHPNYKPISNS